MPAAAIVCAIWPPIVPAPTTAALKTNMGSGISLRDDRARGARGAVQGYASARGAALRALASAHRGDPDLVRSGTSF